MNESARAPIDQLKVTKNDTLSSCGAVPCHRDGVLSVISVINNCVPSLATNLDRAVNR